MKIWHLISDRWRLLSGSVLAGLIIGVVLAFSITPLYRAETVLAPVPDPGQLPGIDALGGQLGGIAGLLGLAGVGQSRTQEYLAALRSHLLTNKFITENKLIPILFEDDYDQETGKWKQGKDEEEPSIEDAYKRFDERVRRINASKQTGLITVAIDWRDPEIASRWANGLIRLANNELREQAIEFGEKSITYLNQELERTNVVEIQQAIYKLIEAQIQNIMIANVREEYAFRVIDPAVIPDVDDRISPNRPLIIVIFLGIGLMFGLLIASFLEDRNPEKL